MSQRREKLRAGIALLEAAARLLEQASTEFGDSLRSPFAKDDLNNAATQARRTATRAVIEYDRAE